LWAVPDADGEHIVWSLPTPAKNEKRAGRHPTQKPRALLERILLAGSNPGELILDPFNGSGTTGVAALATGRHYIGIDLDPSYLDLTMRRFDDQP
jgi:site-specific DNA-methyltransferase (adenine-specific)